LKLKVKKGWRNSKKLKFVTNLQNHSQAQAFLIKAFLQTAQPAPAITGLPAPS